MTTNPLMTFCPCCGNLYSKRAPKCPNCNWPRTATCNICSNQIPALSKACPMCGDPEPFSEDSHAQEANVLLSDAVHNASVNMKTGLQSEIGGSIHEYSSSEVNKGLKGVRGWLLFLVVLMTLIGPVWGGLMTSGSLVLTEEKYPALLNLDRWDLYKSTTWVFFFCIAALSFYGGWGLKQGYNWSVVKRAKTILWITGPGAFVVCSIIIPFICFGKNIYLGNSIAQDQLFGKFIAVSIGTAIWVAYLSRSKRVRNTYDKDIEDNENTPRSSEYNDKASDTDMDEDKNPLPLVIEQRPEHWGI